jgi:hypothetical protein
MLNATFILDVSIPPTVSKMCYKRGKKTSKWEIAYHLEADTPYSAKPWKSARRIDACQSALRFGEHFNVLRSASQTGYRGKAMVKKTKQMLRNSTFQFTSS